MMGLQFGLTARFRYVTDPWGEDVIYHFHPAHLAARRRRWWWCIRLILLATGSDKLAPPGRRCAAYGCP